MAAAPHRRSYSYSPPFAVPGSPYSVLCTLFSVLCSLYAVVSPRHRPSTPLNPPSPALMLAVGIAAVVLIVGIGAFVVLRRRRPKNIDAVPLQELPVEGEPVSVEVDRFAPPIPAHQDQDAALVLDPREPMEVALQPASQPASASPEAAGSAKVTFRMFLPTQGQARSAGQIARRDGYTADVQPPANGEAMWLCLLTREMVASPAAIGEELTFLAELAGSFGGRVER